MFAWFSLGFNAFQLAAAGTALVSAPIIIHLINRMRFRRIRWAAMEFLLKAQKRQRRRLIIEQLILLAMRCLIIAMIAYWFGSFVGFGGDVLNAGGEKAVLHVVVVDDTPSMGDQWKDRGKDKTTAFEEAKRMLRDRIGPRIEESARRNGTAEYLVVYRLSDIQPWLKEDEAPAEDDELIFGERMNQTTLEQLKNDLGAEKMAKPSDVRVSPQVAFDKAVRVFEGKAPEVFDRDGRKTFYKREKTVANGSRKFYFLSDFRESEWKSGGAGDKIGLRDKLEDLVKYGKEGVKVYGVDCTDPARSDARNVSPTHHENVAIISFNTEVAVVPEFEPINFTLVINNFTNRRFEGVHLTVLDNGKQVYEAPSVITLKPGENTIAWKGTLNQIGFNSLEAKLEDPEGLRDTGVAADNVRYAVVKVEKMVHILCIDQEFMPKGADRADSSKAPPTAGTFFVKNVLPAGYRLDSGSLQLLESPALFQYPCVLLMNVPDLSKAAVDNLERFAAEGGGICFFLGDKVKPEEYNKSLFKDGTGLFPAPLDPRIKKLVGDTEEDKRRELQETEDRIKAQVPNLFVRDERHSLFAHVYEQDPERKVNRFLMFFDISQYFGVDPLRFKKIGESDKVEELFTLPNRKNVKEYRPRAYKLIEKLPARDDVAAREYQPTLDDHRRELLAKIQQDVYVHLFDLANDIYKLRNDAGTKDAKGSVIKPALDKFWQDGKNNELRIEFDQFLEDIRYGDPFLVSRQYGKGRVVACLSSANFSWNNWAIMPQLYAPFMPAVVKYLFRQAESTSFDCGSALPEKMTHLSKTLYMNKFEVWRTPKPVEKKGAAEGSAEGGEGSGAEASGEKHEGPDENQPDYEKKLGWTLVYQADSKQEDNGFFKYEFKKGREPGVYVVKRFPLITEGAPAMTERKAVSFNIDASAEGELKRTATDALQKNKPDSEENAGFYLVDRTAKFEELAKKQANFSESPWFYLAFLLLFIAEQAMAVHCGHHTRATDVPVAAEISMHTGRAQASAA
jgi:hypothetical protein